MKYFGAVRRHIDATTENLLRDSSEVAGTNEAVDRDDFKYDD